MKTDAHWYVKLGALLLVTLMMAVMSCGGGGGGTVTMDRVDTGNGASNYDVSKGTGILIHEDEIASLPAWQQELLSDPGWNQPYIALRL